MVARLKKKKRRDWSSSSFTNIASFFRFFLSCWCPGSHCSLQVGEGFFLGGRLPLGIPPTKSRLPLLPRQVAPSALWAPKNLRLDLPAEPHEVVGFFFPGSDVSISPVRGARSDSQRHWDLGSPGFWSAGGGLGAPRAGVLPLSGGAGETFLILPVLSTYIRHVEFRISSSIVALRSNGGGAAACCWGSAREGVLPKSPAGV